MQERHDPFYFSRSDLSDEEKHIYKTYIFDEKSVKFWIASSLRAKRSNPESYQI